MFNTNISHQLFNYTKTFVKSQQYNTNSKGDFVLKNWFTKYRFDSDLVCQIQLISIKG